MELSKIRSKYYCGVDLHDKSMYVCITGNSGEILLSKKVRNNFEVFKEQTKKYIKEMSAKKIYKGNVSRRRIYTELLLVL